MINRLFQKEKYDYSYNTARDKDKKGVRMLFIKGEA